MGWIRKHVTGDPDKVAELEAAQEAVDNYGSANDEEFTRLNNAVRDAAKDVPAARRFDGGWF